MDTITEIAIKHIENHPEISRNEILEYLRELQNEEVAFIELVYEHGQHGLDDFHLLDAGNYYDHVFIKKMV